MTSNAPLDLVRQRLGERGCCPRGRMALCPAHEDRNPSLSFDVGDDGRVLLNCHAGCSTEDVLAALDLTMPELFEPVARRGNGRVPVGSYDYRDERGELLFQVLRYAPKDFRQRRPDGGGGWVWNVRDVRRVLYRLPEVRAAIAVGESVYVVEGEKDADRLARLGLASTCNVGGAGKWKPGDSKALAGGHVVVLADNDDVGRKHARHVAAELDGVAASVRLVELRGLPEHGDVTDWLDAGHDRADLERLVEQADAAPVAPTAGGRRLLARAASEVTTTDVAWLWEDRIAYAKLNVLGGPPGVGKSYITCALAAAVSRGERLTGDARPAADPARTLLLSYEDDPADTVVPRLKLLGADLDRVVLIEGVDHDDQRRALAPEDVDLLRSHINHHGDVRLVVIDPVSAFVGAGTDEHRANEVRAALEGLRVLAQEEGCAVLLVMHTRKSTADTALNRLSGSQAYGALIRSALVAGPIPDDEQGRHALAHVKHNLSARQPTLGYSVDDLGLTWHGEVDIDGEQVAGNDDGSSRGAGEEARAFLRERLADGPVPAVDIQQEADELGIARNTLHRQKKRLGIDSERRDGRWLWLPPPHPTSPRPPEVTLGDVGDLAAQRARNEPTCADCPAPSTCTDKDGSERCEQHASWHQGGAA